MRKLIGLAVATMMTVSACGEGGLVLTEDADAPVLQIRSEGGLVPIERIDTWGPSYTLLTDGRLIHEGPVTMIYPGPLLPNTQVATVTGEEMDRILGLIEEIGLPGMVSERDDSASGDIADATTEVLTYWDADGEHTYSVYALGMPSDPTPATAAAAELVETLSAATFSGESEPYAGDRVRVIAGVSQLVPEPGFEDIRPWPLPGEDPGEWARVASGRSCQVFGPGTFEIFTDATQVTQWLHPNPMMDAPTYTLVVRQLHPGEPDCPV